jgi:hypothetical protein
MRSLSELRKYYESESVNGLTYLARIEAGLTKELVDHIARLEKEIEELKSNRAKESSCS